MFAKKSIFFSLEMKTSFLVFRFALVNRILQFGCFFFEIRNFHPKGNHNKWKFEKLCVSHVLEKVFSENWPKKLPPWESKDFYTFLNFAFLWRKNMKFIFLAFLIQKGTTNLNENSVFSIALELNKSIFFPFVFKMNNHTGIEDFNKLTTLKRPLEIEVQKKTLLFVLIWEREPIDLVKVCLVVFWKCIIKPTMKD